MSISIDCSIELTEEELLFILRRRAGQVIIVQPPEAEKLVPEAEKLVLGAEKLVPEAEKLVLGAEKLVPEPVSALPPKQPRNRAKSNGAEAPLNSTPLAPNTPPPQPEPLDEPAMRSLLSKVGAVHPLKVKAITDLLEAHGGARRLSECDPSTWPAIATAANATLVEYGA